MKTIFKYPLQEVGIQQVDVQYGAEILSIQEVNGDLFMWAKVDTEHDIDQITIEIFGTGHDLREGHKGDGIQRKYLSTVVCLSGLVWHFYEHAEII